MAEEKKPKIDLKARLGKKSVGTAGGGSIPPPVGIPKPAGIPAPPFGSRPTGPKVDASDPYASISAEAAPAAKPHAIKVELSEEVVQAQKKGRTRIMILAGVTAVVGGLLGYTLGGSVANNKWAEVAVGNARELSGNVDQANAKIEELANVLKDAKDKLGSGKYPDDEVGKLGGINIPFDGTYIGGKLGIGRFQSATMRMLLDFGSQSKEANDTKESLQSVLSAAKAPITEMLEMAEKPKVRWGAIVQTGPGGPWLAMTALSDPFMAKVEGGKSWPDTFKVAQGDKKTDIKRYAKGDPTSGDPMIVPVNPQSQAGVCPVDAMVRLRTKISELETMLRGDDTPGEEKEGLLDLGRKLHEALQKVGNGG